MRGGIKVLRNGQPAAGVALVPNLPLATRSLLIPAYPRTDTNGEWFGVAPLAILSTAYLMDVVVDPEGVAIRINGGVDGICNQFFVDLNRRTVDRLRLGDRISGGGYFEVDNQLLLPKEVINVSRDQVRFISNCATCQCFVPPGLGTGFCAVNGLRTTTSRRVSLMLIFTSGGVDDLGEHPGPGWRIGGGFPVAIPVFRRP